MSFECQAWAVKQVTGKMTCKAVLMALANRTNHENGMCRPRIKLIAQDTEMSETTVKQAIKDLVERGFLEVIPRFQEGVQLANDYRLRMDDSGLLRTSGAGGVGREPTQGGSGDDPGWVGSRPPCNQEVEPGSRTSLLSISPPGAKIDATWKARIESLVERWNGMASKTNLPVARLTPVREGLFRARMKDANWEEDFQKAVAWIGGAPEAAWHRGENDRGWRATIDFLLQAKKATELAERAVIVSTPRAASVESMPKWKQEKIARLRADVDIAKREVRKLEAQGLTPQNCASRFQDAEEGVRRAQAALEAELGGPCGETAATGLQTGRRVD